MKSETPRQTTCLDSLEVPDSQSIVVYSSASLHCCYHKLGLWNKVVTLEIIHRLSQLPAIDVWPIQELLITSIKFISGLIMVGETN